MAEIGAALHALTSCGSRAGTNCGSRIPELRATLREAVALAALGSDAVSDDNGRGSPLLGKCVALPETREAARLAQMLEAEGATTLSCPLVAIVDAPDPTPLVAWLRRFIEAQFDDLVLLTGDGVRHLHALARGRGLEQGFLDALSATRKITRGPKPVRALRALGLAPDLRAQEPTTEGVIASLSHEELSGRRVGVQLYPGATSNRLVDFLRGAGAVPDPVVPYAYASQADDDRVASLIARMAAGTVDVIAFTSAPQVRRLFSVAATLHRENQLQAGLAHTVVAAVGPVVSAALEERGITAAIMPAGSYFMKPLVRAIVTALAG